MMKVFQARHEYFSSGRAFDNVGQQTEFGSCFTADIVLPMPEEVSRPKKQGKKKKKSIYFKGMHFCGKVLLLDY